MVDKLLLIHLSCWSSESVPEKEHETEAYHASEDDCISSFSQIDLLHQVVDHGELCGYVIEFGLDGLESDSLVNQGLPSLDGDADMFVDQSFAVSCQV